MKSILVTNTKWKKPTAHATCSYIDSSEYASGPIRRCLFIDYIIIYYIHCLNRVTSICLLPFYILFCLLVGLSVCLSFLPVRYVLRMSCMCMRAWVREYVLMYVCILCACHHCHIVY